MRPLLFAFVSLSVTACATQPSDQPTHTQGGGGGKSDDGTAEEGGCPVDPSDGDAISTAIENAGYCYVAAGIAESCAFGSGIDVQFVAAAEAVCQTGFGAMPAEMMETFQALTERCDAKYADQDGSMYRSFSAYCRLEVTKLFEGLYPQAETEATPAVEWSQACPVDASDADAIETAIRDAGSCGAAADAAEACAWGSGIDVQYVSAAEDTCLTQTLSAADQVTYDKLAAACGDSHPDEEGSLGRSMRAYCGLQLEVVFDTITASVEDEL